MEFMLSRLRVESFLGGVQIDMDKYSLNNL
jgi:hypothetical protein